MGQNTVNFTLSFQGQLETEQLVRSGGKLDPLEKELRIASVNQYEILMTTDPNTKITVPKQWDFRVDKQGKIDPKLSSGFSTFTDEENFPEGFTIKKNRLWKLVKVINGETLMYPIELKRDESNENHFVIKPGVPVSPMIFRQMLRCLPWVKMYCEETKKIVDESK